jgi:hypothetical protein
MKIVLIVCVLALAWAAEEEKKEAPMKENLGGEFGVARLDCLSISPVFAKQSRYECGRV